LASPDRASPDSSAAGISLYIHVPFCAAKCLYCDFFSVPRKSVTAAQERAVVEATIGQARFFLDTLGAQLEGGEASSALETLYVGGGTPSALSPGALSALLAPLRGVTWKEWTVEANPESLTEAFLEACQDAGVSRLSVGIQSMQGRSLTLLGRPGSEADNARALDLLSTHWKREISLDFIAGIPGQSASDIRSDLAAISRVQARHASLYSLTLEPGTGLAAAVEEGSIVLNEPEVDEDLWFAGKDELERRGFENYEISNFCIPGKASLHNLRYWNLEPYLGVGPGAVSTLPTRLLGDLLPRLGLKEKGQESPVCRLSNPDSIEEFLSGPSKLWGMRAEPVAPREFLLESLMMGLRLADGIPAGRLESRFGRSFDELFPGLWARWLDRGLALPPGDRLRLSEQGRLLLDSVLREISDRLEGLQDQRLTVRWA
jgi:oxygen-independent coproporphyrinogen-3 oxidase